MMISSAPNVRSASSIACSGLASPTSPEASMPSKRKSVEAGVESLLGGDARAVLVGCPEPKPRVESWSADEDLGSDVAAPFLDHAP